MVFNTVMPLGPLLELKIDSSVANKKQDDKQ